MSFDMDVGTYTKSNWTDLNMGNHVETGRSNQLEKNNYSIKRIRPYAIKHEINMFFKL